MTDTYGDIYGDTYGAATTGSPADGGSRLWVQVDWAKDGGYTEAGDDVTDYVLARSGISASYGRDQVTALAPTVSGQGSFTLDNRSGRFTTRNTDSPLYGNLKPARPVRIIRQIAGVDYVLFDGHTDDSPINPDLNAQSVAMTLADNLADFNGQAVTTELYSGIRTGDAIGYILDACGWTGGRDLDPGATIIPWWWEDNTDALEALEKLVRSEGPPALLTMGADGSVVFRDRHHRLLREASLESQQTWWGDGNGLVMGTGFTYDDGWRTIVNTGTASVDIRMPRPVAVVWTSDDAIALDFNEERLITVTSSDPFYGAITPVEGTDYDLIDGSITVELLSTSGQSVTMKLSATEEAVRIVNLRLRANPVQVAHTVQISVSHPSSVEEYGPRAFPGDLPWCSRHDARAVLQSAIAQRATPLPILSVPFNVHRDRNKFPVLGLDLSDRVTVVLDPLGLNEDFYIESISHYLTGEMEHVVTFGLEAVPSEPDDVMRVNDLGTGAGVGVAGGGLDDPNLILIVGSNVAGHRVGEGVTAH